jgi:hypothetical protein
MFVRHSTWKWCQLHDNSYQGLALQLSSSFLFKELLYLNTFLSVYLSVCLTLSLYIYMCVCVCVCTSFSVICISLYHSGLTLSLCLFSFSLSLSLYSCTSLSVCVYLFFSLSFPCYVIHTNPLSYTQTHTHYLSPSFFSLCHSVSLSLSLYPLCRPLSHSLYPLCRPLSHTISSLFLHPDNIFQFSLWRNHLRSSNFKLSLFSPISLEINTKRVWCQHFSNRPKRHWD